MRVLARSRCSWCVIQQLGHFSPPHRFQGRRQGFESPPGTPSTSSRSSRSGRRCSEPSPSSPPVFPTQEVGLRRHLLQHDRRRGIDHGERRRGVARGDGTDHRGHGDRFVGASPTEPGAWRDSAARPFDGSSTGGPRALRPSRIACAAMTESMPNAAWVTLAAAVLFSMLLGVRRGQRTNG